jgi:hypothetical protein
MRTSTTFMYGRYKEERKPLLVGDLAPQQGLSALGRHCRPMSPSVL